VPLNNKIGSNSDAQNKAFSPMRAKLGLGAQFLAEFRGFLKSAAPVTTKVNA
jgi:hypothetical protein